jgi:hypothetical protein
MRHKAEVVKLVGTAGQAVDALPILELIANAQSPVIGIAMGSAGLVTRLMAPCFNSCVLTYAAIDDDVGTAPGQIGVHTMTEHFGLDRVGPDTPIDVFMYFDPRLEAEVHAACKGDGTRLRVPLLVHESGAETMRAAFESLSDRIEVSVVSPGEIIPSKE